MAEEPKVAREDNAKLKTKKVKLQKQLQEQQVDLQAIQQNYATECGKVISLEKKLKATEEKMLEATESKAASRDAVIQEAKQQAVEEFKQSEEFKTSFDMSYEDGYDKGVEEIFFNIWHKCCEVDFKFLGKEFKKARC